MTNADQDALPRARLDRDADDHPSKGQLYRPGGGLDRLPRSAATAMSHVPPYTVQRLPCWLNSAELSFLQSLPSLKIATVDDTVLRILFHQDAVLSHTPLFDAWSAFYHQFVEPLDTSVERRRSCQALFNALLELSAPTPWLTPQSRSLCQQLARGESTVADVMTGFRNLSQVRAYYQLLDPASALICDWLVQQYFATLLSQCRWEVDLTRRLDPDRPVPTVRSRDNLAQGTRIDFLVALRVFAHSSRPPSEPLLSASPAAPTSPSDPMAPFYDVGPARLLARSCRPNVLLVADGHGLVTATALCNIGAGQELTVAAEEHLFGQHNECCLCSWCQQQQRGAWTPTTPREAPPPGFEAARDVLQMLLHGKVAVARFLLPDGGVVPRRPNDDCMVGQSRSPLDLFGPCATCRVPRLRAIHSQSSECPRCQRHRDLYGRMWPDVDATPHVEDARALVVSRREVPRRSHTPTPESSPETLCSSPRLERSASRRPSKRHKLEHPPLIDLASPTPDRPCLDRLPPTPGTHSPTVRLHGSLSAPSSAGLYAQQALQLMPVPRGVPVAVEASDEEGSVQSATHAAGVQVAGRFPMTVSAAFSSPSRYSSTDSGVDAEMARHRSSTGLAKTSMLLYFMPGDQAPFACFDRTCGQRQVVFETAALFRKHVREEHRAIGGSSAGFRYACADCVEREHMLPSMFATHLSERHGTLTPSERVELITRSVTSWPSRLSFASW